MKRANMINYTQLLKNLYLAKKCAYVFDFSAAFKRRILFSVYKRRTHARVLSEASGPCSYQVKKCLLQKNFLQKLKRSS